MFRLVILFSSLLLLVIFLFPHEVSAQTCPTLPTDTGTVTLNANIPTSGTYKIWSRIKPSATDVNANSYWLQFGTQCGIKIGDNTSAIPANTWTWVDFRDGSTSQKATVTLSAGDQIFKLIGNESSVGIDRILIVTQADTCIPTGIGDNCSAVATATPTTVLASPTPTRTPTPTISTPTPTRTPTPTPIIPTSTPLPTATPVPNSTRFNMNILLHGIGRGGDNANPGSIGNNTPVHPQKTLTLELYNSSNTLVKTVSGTITFNSTNGNFTGVLDGGIGIASGPYLVKVKGIPYLRKQVGGIISVTSGQTTTLPQAALTVGDANNDNNLNILDYNLLLDCYSELLPPRNCDPQKLLTTDFNDDGAVNQFDYNLFLRELSIQVGQ